MICRRQFTHSFHCDSLLPSPPAHSFVESDTASPGLPPGLSSLPLAQLHSWLAIVDGAKRGLLSETQSMMRSKICRYRTVLGER